MEIKKISTNTSFKGVYKIKGAQRALEDVCGYLKTVSKREGSNFDFIQLRLKTPSPTRASSQIDVYIKEAPDFATLQPEQVAERIEKAMGQKLLLREPKNADKDFVDLVLTAEEKEKFAEVETNIIDDTIKQGLVYVTSLADRMSRILTESMMHREQVGSKTPVISLNPGIIAEHLKSVGILVDKVKTSSAADVIASLKRNAFDIVTGEVN